MRNAFGLVCFLALSISPAIAQETPQPETPSQEAPKQEAPKKEAPAAVAPRQKDHKYEINAVYVFRRFTEQNSSHLDMNGWDASGIWRWKSWVNAEVELSGTYGRTSPSFEAHTGESIYTAFLGPRFTWPGRHKITPFAHFLLGEGYYRRVTSAFGGFNASVYDDFEYAWEAGGGIDVTLRHSDRWAIHLIQVDSDQTKFMGGYTGQRNIRVATGITYRFGTR